MGRNILLIGIGETGCAVAEKFSRNTSGIHSVSFAVDTDKSVFTEAGTAVAVPMTNGASLETVVETIGADNIKEWFPCDWNKDGSSFLKGLMMDKGANLWRTKALLSFASFLGNEGAVASLEEKVKAFVEECGYPCDIEIYTVASLVGGTGGGLFLPLTYYFKNLVKKAGGEVINVSAMLTCPDVYENGFTREQVIKGNSNAYAALRELHAIDLISMGYKRECEIGKHSPTELFVKLKGENFEETVFDSDSHMFANPEAAPFDKVYLFEKIVGLQTVEEHETVVADVLR